MKKGDLGPKILVVDDHYVVRQGLKGMLLEHYANAEFGDACDGQEALECTWKQSWDLVLLDISMPGRGGLDVLKDIRQNFPKLPVIVLSMHPEEQFAIRVLKQGASSYIRKDAAGHELIKGVEAALKGTKYITPSIAQQLATNLERDGNGPCHLRRPRPGKADLFRPQVVRGIFGTRPEAIKLAPIIRAFQKDGELDVRVCVTAVAATAPDEPANQSNINGQSVSQCLPDLRVCSITLSSSKSGSTYTVTGKITVVESTNPQGTIQGATVKVTWTRPKTTDVSQSGVTNSGGIVSFSTPGPGSTYTLSVTGVSKTGYNFDTAGSTLTKSITN